MGRYRVAASRYSAGIWSGVQLIDNGSGDAAIPKIAVDVHGNAIAVRDQYDGVATNDIIANRYVAGLGGGWGTAAPIETGVGAAFDPAIAVDANGNAIVVWEQSDGTTDNIVANRYSAGAWGTAQLIENDNAGHALFPQVTVDAMGNAIAVWEQFDGTTWNIVANRYSAGTWGTAQLVETRNAGDAHSPQVAVDASGNAIAVWYQDSDPNPSNDNNDIWANCFAQ